MKLDHQLALMNRWKKPPQSIYYLPISAFILISYHSLSLISNESRERKLHVFPKANKALKNAETMEQVKVIEQIKENGLILKPWPRNAMCKNTTRFAANFCFAAIQASFSECQLTHSTNAKDSLQYDTGLVWYLINLIHRLQVI